MAFACISFDKLLRTWDGFGFNYVAAFQTHDYHACPQDYGSFALLSELARTEILEAIFGDHGLHVSSGKLFIDPWGTGNSQLEPEGLPKDTDTIDFSKYDFGWTTVWQRYFWKEGLKRIRARGQELSLLATLYCPPGWMTLQKKLRGRDLDPTMKHELAKYLITYIKYMRDQEGLPLRAISLFNEGEIDCRIRWPQDGQTDPSKEHGDYNMLWPIEQMIDFVKMFRPMLDRNGLADIQLAYGECTFLHRAIKYCSAVSVDQDAMRCLGMFGSHGFGDSSDCFTDTPLARLRKNKPDLHGWITSDTFGNMDINFPVRLYRHMYISGINGYIPWAGIQCRGQWRGGDPNPGTAVVIHNDGSYELTRGYFLYKHFSSAGQAGMAIADTFADTDNLLISAFAPNGTDNPESFVVINRNTETCDVVLSVEATRCRLFSTVQTDNSKTFKDNEQVPVVGNTMHFSVPPMSVTTFTGA